MIKIHTEKAPAAVGPYSQAIVSRGMVYTSGQIAINPKLIECDLFAAVQDAVDVIAEPENCFAPPGENDLIERKNPR